MGKKNKKKNKNKNKNKNKKVEKMGLWESTKKTFRGWGNQITKPKEDKDPNTLNVVLFKQSHLDKIAEDCLPKAGGSEFQVQYRGLQIIIQKPESEKRVVFTVPTVFFNMPQKVTSGSVDYNLDQIAERSQQVKPISDKLAAEFMKAFPVAFFKAKGFEIQARELEMGSIHRHPGNFGFSTIDLDNQVEKPGVIFRRLQCEDLIQVDSVIYIPNKAVNLVTTETRVITVKPSADGGIEGWYKEAPTMSYIIQDGTAEVGFGEFFDVEDKSKIKFKYDKTWFSKDYEMIEGILEVFVTELKDGYNPVSVINPDDITQAYSYAKTRTYGNGYNYYNSGWDDVDEYGDYDISYANLRNKKDSGTTTNTDTKTAGETMTTEERRMLYRPTYRPTQTLSLLRTRKINLKDYPEIDGKGSDKDMLTIVKALKDNDYTDDEVRTFMVTTGYPAHDAIDMYYEDLASVIEPLTDVEEGKGESSNIVQLLRMSKNDAEFFEAIDILKDSGITDEEITEYLKMAGQSDAVLVRYHSTRMA